MKNKNKQKKEKNVLASGAANCAWSLLCTLAAALIVSALLGKTDDPSRNLFTVSMIFSGVGGFLCALLSFINCKNDVFLCSAVSGLCFCIAVSLGSLLFDNTGKDTLFRFLPLCIILLSSLLFGLFFRLAAKKKRRSLR